MSWASPSLRKWSARPWTSAVAQARTCGGWRDGQQFQGDKSLWGPFLGKTFRMTSRLPPVMSHHILQRIRDFPFKYCFKLQHTPLCYTTAYTEICSPRGCWYLSESLCVSTTKYGRKAASLSSQSCSRMRSQRSGQRQRSVLVKEAEEGTRWIIVKLCG